MSDCDVTQMGELMAREQEGDDVPELKASLAQPMPIHAESAPIRIMQLAMDKNIDLDKIEKLIELQAKWEALEAKKAFTVAMTEFKSDPPLIHKDKKNAQYNNSLYTSLGNLVNSSLPKMSKCGLSHRWDVNQEEQITVTCIVTHEKGYSKPTSVKAPPDASGKKNPIQEIKSTITYLKTVTFENAMGLASTDANVDDDGNGSYPVKYVGEKEQGAIRDMLADTDSDEGNFLKWLRCESIDKIDEQSYRRGMANLRAKKERKQNDNR